MAYIVLIGKMAQDGIEIKMLAELLKIHRNSASKKIKGESSFTIGEAILVRDTFFPDETLENLFRKDKETHNA